MHCEWHRSLPQGSGDKSGSPVGAISVRHIQNGREGKGKGTVPRQCTQQSPDRQPPTPQLLHELMERAAKQRLPIGHSALKAPGTQTTANSAGSCVPQMPPLAVPAHSQPKPNSHTQLSPWGVGTNCFHLQGLHRCSHQQQQCPERSHKPVT